MATYDHDLLQVAQHLARRRAGQRGKLPSARIRRSISTAYYALFHFVLDEAARTLIGTHNDLRRRRRVVARTFGHGGMRIALEKVRSPVVDGSVADLLRSRGTAAGSVASPDFARNLASAFFDAQSKLYDADYDLNKEFSEADAHVLISRLQRVIADWRMASTTADIDFKHSLCMLMLLKGQLRRET
ncbi:MAG TPA: hypothetical protein VGG99_12725 [Acetobacteraceae bacterium]